MTNVRVVAVQVQGSHKPIFRLWDHAEMRFLTAAEVFGAQVQDKEYLYHSLDAKRAANEADVAGYNVSTEVLLNVRSDLYQQGIRFEVQAQRYDKGMYSLRSKMTTGEGSSKIETSLAFWIPANVTDVRLCKIGDYWFLREEVEAAGTMLPAKLAWRANTVWPLNCIEVEVSL